MNKSRFLNRFIVVLLFGVLVPYVTAIEVPPASELITQYTQALDSTSSFVEEYEKKTVGSTRSNTISNGGTSYSRGVLRYDKQKIYEYEYRWGEFGPFSFTKDKPHYTTGIVNEEMTYQNTKKVGDSPGKVIRLPRPEGLDITLYAHFGISYLAGYMGSAERLDDVLRKADHVFVRRTTQKINDSECYVLEADTKYGDYTIWFDPEHGFHPAQIHLKGEQGDYSGRHLMANGDTAKEYLENVRFERIDGVWVPMEADSGQELHSEQANITTKSIYHYKRTKISLNPNHDHLGSFTDPLENPVNDPELTDGTHVLLGSLPVTYTWKNGALVPDIDTAGIDQLDEITDNILSERNLPQKPDTSATLEQILAEYRKAQMRFQKFYCEGEVKKNGKKVTEDLYTCDGSVFSAQIRGENYVTNSFSWDKNITIQIINDSLLASVSREKSYQLLATDYLGAPLLGYLNGQPERIDSLLSKVSDKATVSQEKQDGKMCLVVRALIGNENWQVWFSPEHGYQVVKAEIQQGTKSIYLLDRVQFKTIEHLHIPVVCSIKNATQEYMYTRTKIGLKPDFSAFNAAKSAIADGTRITIDGLTGKYYWNNGRFVDEEGKDVF